MNETFTCSVCLMTSHNRNDVVNSYCGNCHQETRPRGLSLHLSTEREHLDTNGGDTIILKPPEAFWVTVQGRDRKPALAVADLSRFLLELCEEMAASLGDQLHHADFKLTSEPSVVHDWGLMHDCSRCRAGVDRALALLAEKPDEALLVGRLYWVKR